MSVMGCMCSSYDTSCWMCRASKQAYLAGKRAYKQGKSRHTKHSHSGYSYRWSAGWHDARDENPNTARERTKEQGDKNRAEIRRLKRERTEIDRKIAALSATKTITT